MQFFLSDRKIGRGRWLITHNFWNKQKSSQDKHCNRTGEIHSSRTFRHFAVVDTISYRQYNRKSYNESCIIGRASYRTNMFHNGTHISGSGFLLFLILQNTKRLTRVRVRRNERNTSNFLIKKKTITVTMDFIH